MDRAESGAGEAQAGMFDMQLCEVDGVPVFHVAVDGPTTAGLVFRTGQGDETVVTRGTTHLVEHLAMSALGSRPYSFNATVTGTTTSFFARGTSAEVGEFLRSVCAALTALPVDRIGIESRVLRTEASQRRPGAAEHQMFLRYGCVGHGLLSFFEFGLNRPRADLVRDWANSRFTRGNCAVWIAGAMPDGLSLPLPPGVRIPPPEQPTIHGPVFPAYAPQGEGVVTIGLESARSGVSTAVLQIATELFHERIRVDRGLTYQIAAARHNINTKLAHNTLLLTCLAPQAAAVRDAALAILRDLASRGPDGERLAAHVADHERHVRDPHARSGGVAAAAEYEITGMPAAGQVELLEEARSITPEQCAEELSVMLQTALVVAPAAAGGVPTGFHPYPFSSDRVVAGNVHRRVADRWPWKKGEEIIVGHEGITWRDPTGRTSTVLWSHCVGVLHDGPFRAVFGADGFHVAVRPEIWRGGSQIIDRIDAATPPKLHVSSPDETSGDPESDPQRISFLY